MHVHTYPGVVLEIPQLIGQQLLQQLLPDMCVFVLKCSSAFLQALANLFCSNVINPIDTIQCNM